MAETQDPQDDPDYLWDKSGEPDPEITRLERLLAPFGHDGAPLEIPSRAQAVKTARPTRWRLAAVAAAAIAAAAARGYVRSRSSFGQSDVRRRQRFCVQRRSLRAL